jgi:Tfp pilus assembly protein PilW
MTLPEMLIAVGVGSLVLMSVMAIFLCSNVSFLAMGNYVSLDQSSRLAVEQMTRDIRNCQNLVSFSTNQLIFVYSGTVNLTYSYDSSAGKLVSWKTGGTTNTLLTGCDSLAFSMYSNVAQPGGTLTNATTVSQAKAISTAWKCSRQIRGAKVNSENMQEALIVIRNKPVS